MNEFEVVVAIDTESGLHLESEIALTYLPPAIKSALLSGSGRLNCVVRITAINAEEASDQAALFAESVAGLLSYAYKAITAPIQVERCSQLTGSNQSTVSRSFSADAVLRVVVTQDGSQQFLKLASGANSSRAKELLSMHRQAKNEHSVGGRYLLMYRLIEFCKGNQKNVDDWIRLRKAGVEVFKDRNDDQTVYTYLRNRIHPGGRETLYPYAEVSRHLGEIEEMARQVIAEECGLA